MRNPVRASSNSVTLFTLLLLLLFSVMHSIPEYELATAQTKTTRTTMALASNVLTYESSDYGFVVQYPANWQKVEFSKGIEEGTRNMVVNFLSPLEGPRHIPRVSYSSNSECDVSRFIPKDIYNRTNGFFKRL